jgi:hypothetical protein
MQDLEAEQDSFKVFFLYSVLNYRLLGLITNAVSRGVRISYMSYDNELCEKLHVFFSFYVFFFFYGNIVRR